MYPENQQADAIGNKWMQLETEDVSNNHLEDTTLQPIEIKLNKCIPQKGTKCKNCTCIGSMWAGDSFSSCTEVHLKEVWKGLLFQCRTQEVSV